MDDAEDYQIDVRSESVATSADARRLGDAIRLALRKHKRRTARISVAVIDDDRMAALHEEYLGKTGPTDCLSFDLSDGGGKGALEGEVVVSGETAVREARERDLREEAELTLYVIHGVLHLLGYDDLEPEAAQQMHDMEDRLLGELGFGPVYGAGSK